MIAGSVLNAMASSCAVGAFLKKEHGETDTLRERRSVDYEWSR